MPLQSPMDDLRRTTLQAISGLLAKLEYLSDLRTQEGHYSHWGLARLHGEAAAQEALQEAHRAALSGVLRTPLRRMMQDAATASQQKGMEPAQYVKGLRQRMPELLPPNAGSASEKHLSAVLHALASLLKTQ